MEKSLLVQSRIWAGYVLISLIFVLLEAFSPVTAQSVTIATDQDDYFPGQWVIITGSGWQNNDSVQLSLTHVEPLPDPFHLHDPWFVKPDSIGDIYYEWFVGEQELGTSFDLTAVGIPTGESATTFFTDAIKSESYPQKFNQLTGANTYCQNTSPQDITVSWIFTTCTGNGTGNSNIPLTITWYSNTVNSNNGGISLGSRSLNQNAISATYQPSTATVGTLYYYAVLSWGAGSYCVTAGSISSGTIGVTVTAPSVVPSVTISSTAQTICAGTQVTFTAYPVNGGTNPSYQWKRNGSDIGNNNPLFTSSVLTEGDVITCALSSSAQCITQAVVYSNSITMKVNPKPTGVISGSQSMCSGSRAELMINVTGTGPWSGTLSDGISFNGSENPVKVYVSPDKNTTYSLVSLNDANCTSVQADLSGSAKVSVLNSPTATIEINGTNPVCYNTASGIKFTGPPDGTVTYKINDGDAITGSLNHGGNLTLETAPLTANTTFTLINVSNGSCSEPANGSVTLTLESTPPSWTTLAGSLNIKLECSDAAGLANEQSKAPEASDNCGGTLIPIKTAGSLVTGSGCPNTGTYTNSWIVYDAAGNKSSEFTQVITIVDETAPTFSMPGNITIYKDKDGNFDASVIQTGDVENETDNCSSGLQAIYKDSDPVPGSCEGSVIIKRTWSLVDKCGNPAEDQVQVITVLDNTSPTFTKPEDKTVYKGSSCDYDVSVSVTGDVTDEHDNCSTGLQATYIDADPVAGACEGSVIIKRTWSLVDKCGNPAEDQVQTITVLDNAPPTFTAPNNTTIYKDASCNYNASISVTGDVTDENDNCSTGLEATYDDVVVPDALRQGELEIHRTWSLKDKCGNAAENQVQVIMVLDNTPPAFTAPKNTNVYKDASCEYDASLSATGDVVNETDNCSTGLQATYKDEVVVPDASRQGEIEIHRTWSLKDKCDNAAEDQVQVIMVLDNTPPTFTKPEDKTVYKDATCDYDVSVSVTGKVMDEHDNCSTGLQATYIDADPVAGACEGSVIIKRTWSLVDKCGNPAEDQVQTITVLDNTPPTFTKPEDKTVYKGATCDYDVSISVTGEVMDEHDNCSTGLQATYIDADPVAGACEGSVIIKRTWSLVDKCGNPAEDQVQTITVLDNTPPTFTAPNNTTIYKDASCNYNASISVTGDVTDENDNCSTGLQATYIDADPVAGACEGSVIIKRTWSLVDKCGNPAEDQVQTITVLDNIPPTFTAPKNTTIYKDALCGYDASVSETGDVTDEGDNCSKGIQATYVDTDATPAGSCKGMEVIRRTWSLSDKCGNAAADQIQFITVLDNIKPVFTSSVANGAIVDVAYDPSSCGAVYNYTISANDNCSGVVTPVLNKGLSSGSTFPKGSTVVTYSAKDECGNESEYSFTIRVNKAEAVSELTVSSLPVSTDPAEQQYSDQVKLSVIVRNGYSSCGADAATGVNFYIGSQLMNSSPVTFKQMGTGNDMKAELTVALMEPGAPNGQMSPTAPGTRTVSAKLVSVNSELYNVADPAVKTLIIRPEDARTNFTGTSLVATSSATSGSAIVTLRTTIQDITAIMDPATDSYPGDIRNARVRFFNGSTAISGYLTPTLINGGDLKTGVVSFSWTPNIGTATDAEFSIYTEVSGYYTNTSELTVVTVYKPTGDFITGGGYIIPQKTQGTYSSEKYTGLKTNFGFNVKYNKNGSNLQGNMNFIIRNWVNGVLHTYQVKANSMTSLGVDISKLTEQKAVFVSKANLTDITNPLMPVSIAGNLSLQINMTDKGEPGGNDMIGISLWDAGTLLYSNNWNGSSTEQQLLGGGNLLVHSGYSLNPGLTAPSLVKAMAIPEERNIKLRTYPNPFTDHLYFEIDFPSKGKACLELFDMSGAKIATLLNEEVDAQFYRFEYLPDEAAGGVIVYRLSVNGFVLKTGKVIKK